MVDIYCTNSGGRASLETLLSGREGIKVKQIFSASSVGGDGVAINPLHVVDINPLLFFCSFIYFLLFLLQYFT